MDSRPDQLIANGYKASQQGRWQDARGLFASAIELARDAAGPEVLARALTGFGKMERNLGNLESALHYYSQAAEILRTLLKPLELAHTVRHIGDILFDSGALKLAAPAYEEALALYRANPSAPALDRANMLAGYARLLEAEQEVNRAILFWHEARALYQQVQVQGGIDEAACRLQALGAGKRQ